MAALLPLVFVLQLAIHLVNTFGASTINSLLWRLFNCIPTSTSKSLAEQRQSQSQFLKIRKEMNVTSSQDEFAKWAKLRRQHDKLLEQLEKSKASTDSTQVSFNRTITTIRWLGTNGFRMFLQFWYARQPIFWLPQGWMPYYAEWLLSFPRAPLGSISIQAWSLACAAVILLVSDALIALIALFTKAGLARRRKETPVKASGDQVGEGETKERKKDL